MVPYLDNDTIFHKANDFLCQYHPSFECPIPIDLIAEKNLGLVIFPVANLERYCDVHGGISKDFKSILVDERQYTEQEERTRFTIAHEIGHLILHSKIFLDVTKISTNKEYIDFQNHISIDDHKKLEIQASLFAEEILFPKDVLRKTVESSVKNLGGIDNLVFSDVSKIISDIEKQFGVTQKAAFSKFQRDYRVIIERIQANIPF